MIGELPRTELDLDSWTAGLLNRHPMVGVALGVVRDGRLEYFKAHGLASIERRTPIDHDTIFRVASISKTFTAVAVMQLVERGRVSLDRPANDYLRAFALIPASDGRRPATVRHLLTHTSGIPETVHVSRTLRYLYGESYSLDEEVPTPGEYYNPGIRLRAEPGTRFVYTDHNFCTLGQIVEDVSGQPLDAYLRENVFRPIGMLDTELVRSERVRSRLATGYHLTPGGPRAIQDRQWLTAAASHVYSSPRDMARYLAALVGGGANELGSILRPETLVEMFRPQYTPDPRIPGIGLAFDRFQIGQGHLMVGHEGVLPGFNSQIFLAPEDGVGVMVFTNGARMAMMWLPDEAARLLRHVLGLADVVVMRDDVPQHPELWGELCGFYPLEGPLTDMRLRATLGLGAEVFVRRGALMVRVWSPLPAAFRGFELHPDDEKDPYSFRIDGKRFGIGSARVVFAPEAGGHTRLSFDLMPIAVRRRVDGEHFQLVKRVVGGIGVAGALALALGRARGRVTPARGREDTARPR